MPNFLAERKIEDAQVLKRLAEILQTVYTDRQAISQIQASVTGLGKGPEAVPTSGWKPFAVQEQWGGYDQTTWFKLNVTIPAHMKGARVVALVRAADTSFIPQMTGLTEGGESLAYINGQPFQGLDRNRDDLLLSAKAKGGEKFEIVLEACPSTRFDIHHIFAYADIAVFNQQVWDFYWDCKLVAEVCEVQDDNFAPIRQLKALLKTTVQSIDLQHKGEASYYQSINKAQKSLRKALKSYETSYGMGKLILAGHSHIDTAWLWPLRETQRKCSRTFSTILELMDRYPDFYFSCSQPIQYDWIKSNFPSIYKRIKQRVKEGRWELCGAPWVEPDHNVPAGESIVRQYLYGNRFFEKEFGRRSHIAWVPDSFGYTWSLPQIMKKCGLTAFITTKIDWGQFTDFPYSMFNWEGIDGTQIMTVMPPLNYNGNPEPKDCLDQWNLFKQKDLVEELPYPIGWGDGGGGPTAQMIERGRRMANIVGMPQCEFGRIEDTVDRMEQQTEKANLPVYNGELYLELHRACQTTQARAKRNNRKCEFLLHDTEFLSSLALLEGGKYENAALIEAWKIVLTNQFHDILPGSSITEVHVTAERDYAEARQAALDIRDRAIKHLVKQIDTRGDGRAVVVFNSLSWVRSELVELAAENIAGDIRVIDSSGQSLPCQRAESGDIIFQAEALPPLGYSVFRIVDAEPGIALQPATGKLSVSSKAMENDFIKVRFDKFGRITSLYDKRFSREVLEKGQKGNVLQLFDDRPHDHDAWDIDHNFEDLMWEPAAASSIEVIEEGPVRAVLRIKRATEKSTFVQDITLHANSPRLDFKTHVDWQEKRTLLKVAFPVDVRSSMASYDIQYGSIERATHHNTPFDKARFEVTGIKWADLSEGDYGVSLLNDSKYGYDVHRNVLRLSLLRSSIDPDPTADEGEHDFTYSIYPHGGNWRTSTVQSAYELNVPLLAVLCDSKPGKLPAANSFATVDAEHVVIEWIKKHEDSDAIIVRLYEAYGQRGKVKLMFKQQPTSVTECNLVEEEDVPVSLKATHVDFSIKPFEVRTFKVCF